MGEHLTKNILLDPIEVAGIFALKMIIPSGSSSDPKGKRGLHQILGSVLSRGCGPYKDEEISDFIEGLGASLRCDSNEDSIIISLKCSDEDSDKLIPILINAIQELEARVKTLEG